MIKNLKKKKGFTLIELIIVIAILGILSAIAVPKLSQFRNQAQIRADIATYDIIDKSIAIAATDGTLGAGIVVIDTGADGACTWDETTSTAEGTDDLSDIMDDLLQDTPTFEVDGNASLANITWTIAADGSITSPVINRTTGVITP